MNLIAQKTSVILILLLLINYSVKAQETIESFDDVNNLQANGWVFINNSDVIGSDDWSQGVASDFPAQAGSADSYIANTTATTGANLVCNWLIMPDIGSTEQLSFYTRSQNIADEVTQMRVMYSPTGSINTGGCSNAPAKANTNNTKGSLDFGDFGTLLTINVNQLPGIYPQDWMQYTVDINGNGRIAFLYFVETGAPNFNSGTLAIDTITRSVPAASTIQTVPSLNVWALLTLLLAVIFVGLFKTNKCTI